MPIEPHRIEAAARAIWKAPGAPKGLPEWADVRPETQDWYREVAANAIALAYPELAAGTAWVAPWGATEAMQADMRDAIGEWLPRGEVAKPVTDQWQIGREVYERARDAHLSKGKDDDHG